MLTRTLSLARTSPAARRLVALALPLLLVGALAFPVAAGKKHKKAFKKGVEFSEARAFFELNDTDGDLGFQFEVDGDEWKSVRLFAPNGRVIVGIDVRGSAKVVGLTQINSESGEPPFDELPMEEFLKLFPEGDYVFIGRSVDNTWLFGVATLTHNIPDAPDTISPAEDEEVDSTGPVLVMWDAVADPDPPASVIEYYEVIVENEDTEQVFEIELPATATSVTVPPQFMTPGTEYKYEVLAVETSGNKTITEVAFTTAD